MRYSKILSLATAAYGTYALVKPRHLATALEAPTAQAPAFDRVSFTYAGRDLGISGLAVASKNPSVVSAMMVLRIVGDLCDAAILGTTATTSRGRNKVLGATLGWGVLNTVALVVDRRRLAA